MANYSSYYVLHFSGSSSARPPGKGEGLGSYSRSRHQASRTRHNLIPVLRAWPVEAHCASPSCGRLAPSEHRDDRAYRRLRRDFVLRRLLAHALRPVVLVALGSLWSRPLRQAVHQKLAQLGKPLLVRGLFDSATGRIATTGAVRLLRDDKLWEKGEDAASAAAPWMAARAAAEMSTVGAVERLAVAGSGCHRGAAHWGPPELTGLADGGADCHDHLAIRIPSPMRDVEPGESEGRGVV